MLEVYFCERGDVFVFEDGAPLWSPYGTERLAVQQESNSQQKVVRSFPGISAAEEFARQAGANADTYLRQLAVAARRLKGAEA